MSTTICGTAMACRTDAGGEAAARRSTAPQRYAGAGSTAHPVSTSVGIGSVDLSGGTDHPPISASPAG